MAMLNNQRVNPHVCLLNPSPRPVAPWLWHRKAPLLADLPGVAGQQPPEVCITIARWVGYNTCTWLTWPGWKIVEIPGIQPDSESFTTSETKKELWDPGIQHQVMSPSTTLMNPWVPPSSTPLFYQGRFSISSFPKKVVVTPPPCLFGRIWSPYLAGKNGLNIYCNMQGYKQLQTNQKFKFHAFINADVPKVAPCQVGTKMKNP